MSSTAVSSSTSLDAARARWRVFGVASVSALLAFGVLLLAYGFYREPDAIAIGWHPEGRRAVSYALGVAALIAGLAAWRRWPVVPVAVAALMLFGASAVGVGAVVAVAGLLVASLQVGFLVLRPDERAPGLHALFATAVGLAAYAALMQVAARAPVHYPIVYALLLVAPFAIGRTRTAAHWSALLRAMRSMPASMDWSTRVLWMVACAGVVIRFIGVLAPEVGVDAMGMHLEMPWLVARDHVWSPKTTEFTWAWMPLAVNWVFAIAFQLGGEAAVRLLNFAVDLLGLMMCAAAARVWRGPRAGAIAAVISSTLPLRYLLTTSLFVETVWSFWLGAALLAMALLLRGMRRDVVDFAAAGLLIGAALASKLMTVFWVFAVVAFLVGCWRGGRLDVRRAVAFAATAAVVGLWPYAAAWMETGNPVFPFMNEVFKSPLMPAAPLALAPYNAGISVTTLFDATFHTDHYLESSPGGLGLSLLVLLPAGLVAAVWRGAFWERTLVACSLIVVAISFHFTAYLRYVAPVLPIWAVLIAGGLEGVGVRRLRTCVALVAGVAGVAGLALSANSTWGYRFLPPLGPIDPARYAEWEDIQRPEMHIVRSINDLGLKHVLWIGRPYFVGLKAHVSVESWHQNAGWTALRTRDDLAAWVKARGIDGIVMTPGIAACATVICEALPDLGDPYEVFRGVRFYRLVPGELRPVPPDAGERKPFSEHRLADEELTGSPAAAWTGEGAWDRDQGVMRLAAGQRYAQRVDVEAGQRYAYVLRTRCAADAGYFRAQVEWQRADGGVADTVVQTFQCSADWGDVRVEATAPPDASAALVGAAVQGIAPVEFDRMELLE